MLTKRTRTRIRYLNSGTMPERWVGRVCIFVKLNMGAVDNDVAKRRRRGGSSVKKRKNKKNSFEKKTCTRATYAHEQS